MMKKLIAILLLGALLTLSFVGCNEQPNSGVTPNNTDNATTPEVTTPEPEVTTPEPEQNLVTELFGNDLLEFSPIFFAQSSVFSSTGDKDIRVLEGNIYINECLYEISYNETADIKYYDTYSSWGVEENEENMNILNTLKNSTSYYLLETQAEEAWYKKVGLIEIDGVYYFLELNDSGRVRRIHYINLNQGE